MAFEWFFVMGDDEKYFDFISPFVKKIDFLKNKSDDELKRIALIFKQEIHYGQEIVDLLNEIVTINKDLSEDEKEMINKESSKKVIEFFKKSLQNLDEINEITVKQLFKDTQASTGIKGKDLFMPIRIKLTGHTHGIEMFNIIDILGKEETLSRL